MAMLKALRSAWELQSTSRHIKDKVSILKAALTYFGSQENGSDYGKAFLLQQKYPILRAQF